MVYVKRPYTYAISPVVIRLHPAADPIDSFAPSKPGYILKTG
nr:MAG TPA: hypothetical protein [Caudoviricetes sp.]